MLPPFPNLPRVPLSCPVVDLPPEPENFKLFLSLSRARFSRSLSFNNQLKPTTTTTDY